MNGFNNFSIFNALWVQREAEGLPDQKTLSLVAGLLPSGGQAIALPFVARAKKEEQKRGQVQAQLQATQAIAEDTFEFLGRLKEEVPAAKVKIEEFEKSLKPEAPDDGVLAGQVNIEHATINVEQLTGQPAPKQAASSRASKRSARSSG